MTPAMTAFGRKADITFTVSRTITASDNRLAKCPVALPRHAFHPPCSDARIGDTPQHTLAAHNGKTPYEALREKL